MPHSHAENRRMAVMLAMLMSIMPFSIDTYLPSLPQIAQSLNSDIHYIEKSLSTFFLALPLGKLSVVHCPILKGDD